MEIIRDFIPSGNRNRPGTRIVPTHITVHETANTSKGANAEVHARYLKGADARNRSVSWHFTVDDKIIFQHLPTNEMGWHAGARANLVSIGIELCVNSDGDFERTKKNAQWLIRKLMDDLNIPLSRVVTHYDWTKKNCPQNLLPTFEQFKRGVVTVAIDSTPSSWAKDSWEKAMNEKNKIFDGTNPKEPVTREQLAVILDRLGLLK